MIHIQVISFGKIDKTSYGDDIERYIKMARPWATIEMINLKSKSVTQESLFPSLLSQEGDMILGRCKTNTTMCTLSEEGKSLSTKELSAWISSGSGKMITFIVGSAYGLTAEIKERADLNLSLSPMTMPYKLTRLVLLEQIYRSLAIVHNHPYHKE